MTKIPNKSRLFVGLPLSDEARRGVLKVIKTLKRKHWRVKWEPAEKWHGTLVFLGDIQVAKVAQVAKVVQVWETGKPFTLKFKGLGRFPEPQRVPRFGERVTGRMAKTVRLHPKDTITLPKIIWLGLKGDLKAMYRITKVIRQEFMAQSIWFDLKPLHPHITLGRVERDCSRGELVEIAKEIEKMHDLEIPQKWVVDRVCLYESVLKQSGSEYQVVDEVKLV
jgi:2'-5' RNA ligase